jgi:hypothetical protein
MWRIRKVSIYASSTASSGCGGFAATMSICFRRRTGSHFSRCDWAPGAEGRRILGSHHEQMSSFLSGRSHGLPALVDHHPDPTTARLTQPRRIPRPNNRHRLGFHYRVQLSGTAPLLRQFSPKGTNLARWNADELDAVAHTLNIRPRKILGWRTPTQVWTEHTLLIEQAGVATTGCIRPRHIDQIHRDRGTSFLHR